MRTHPTPTRVLGTTLIIVVVGHISPVREVGDDGRWRPRTPAMDPMDMEPGKLKHRLRKLAWDGYV